METIHVSDQFRGILLIENQPIDIVPASNRWRNGDRQQMYTSGRGHLRSRITEQDDIPGSKMTLGVIVHDNLHAARAQDLQRQVRKSIAPDVALARAAAEISLEHQQTWETNSPQYLHESYRQTSYRENTPWCPVKR